MSEGGSLLGTGESGRKILGTALGNEKRRYPD